MGGIFLPPRPSPNMQGKHWADDRVGTTGRGSLLVVYCASGDSLIEQLGALRCAVCIARALGAELVIPRWKCGLYWLASEHVIDAAPLAALVPLVSEQDAQARCTTRTAVADPALPFSVLPTRVSTFRCPQVPSRRG